MLKTSNINKTIPPEIMDFFDIAGNVALLVKGEPGTGKTIFSLQYIASQAEKGCGIYFSTRIDTTSLYSQFPWIRESIPPENIVDATQSIVPRRMDVPQLIRFSSLPEFLKGLYTVVEERKSSGSPLIVVDSVDAVAASVGLSVEETCAKIVDAIRGAEIKTLIITERVEKTALDYICDGVITFKKTFIDERIFRELIIEKLRGTKILNSFYYFTLYKGQFIYFDRFSPVERRKRIYEPHPVIKDGKGTKFYENGMFSTGSQEIDKLTNGFRKGSFILIEVVGEFPFEFLIDITAPIVENFMLQGRGVVVVSCKSISPRYFFNIFSNLVGREVVEKYCKIIAPIGSNPEKTIPWLICTDRSMNSILEAIVKTIEQVKRDFNEKALVYLSFDRLEADLGSENTEKIAIEIISRIKFEEDLCIGIAFPNTEITPKLREMADVVFRIFSKRGIVFVYGVHPPSIIYNINIDTSLPHPKMYFTPIT